MNLWRIVLVASCAMFTSPYASAGDWPEFRGPTAQGIYEGKPLPTQWGPQKNITWQQPIAGLGWSSPAIVGGKIYLTTAVPNGKDQSLRAICLNVDSGKTVWDVEVFHQDGANSPGIHGKNSHASPSPIVRDGKVYVHFGHQGTACLDLDGKEVWKTRELKYPPVHGNGGSPILLDDRLILSCDGASNPFVAALSAADGKLLWKTPRNWDSIKKFAFATPLAVDVNGKTQVVLPGAGGVAAYDPKTGTEIWSVRYNGYSVIPRPVFGHGMVFVSSSFDSATMFAIRVDGTGDVTDTHVAWKLNRGAPHSASPLLVGDELYLVSDGGLASCLDAKTGKAHWKEQRLPGGYSSSPLFANGNIYFENETGVVTVVKASKTFTVVAKNAMNEQTLSSLAAADGALFLRTEKAIYRIEDNK
jgi:outer membrane protein assembly factor BamB